MMSQQGRAAGVHAFQTFVTYGLIGSLKIANCLASVMAYGTACIVWYCCQF